MRCGIFGLLSRTHHPPIRISEVTNCGVWCPVGSSTHHLGDDDDGGGDANGSHSDHVTLHYWTMAGMHWLLPNRTR